MQVRNAGTLSGFSRWSAGPENFSLYSDILAAPRPVRNQSLTCCCAMPSPADSVYVVTILLKIRIASRLTVGTPRAA